MGGTASQRRQPVTGHAAILDMCCGSRMFWFDKNDDRAIFSDIRKEEHTLCDGRRLIISPDLIADFRALNRPGFPGECFICELRLPDHRFRWKHNKLFLLLPEEYGPAFPAIVDCYTSPPTLVWPVPLLHGFSSSYGVLPPLCKDH